MHGTFYQSGPLGSGLDRFFPVFGVKMIKNMKILLHFGFSQVTFDVPDLKKKFTIELAIMAGWVLGC